jgi:hypothetical protein
MSSSDDKTFATLSSVFRREYVEVTNIAYERISETRVLVVVDSTAPGRPSVTLRQTAMSLEDCFERLRRRVSPTPEGA